MSNGQGIVVFGVDPGSNKTGYGIVREVSGQVSLLDAGVIRTPSGKDMAHRLGVIHARVAELTDAHKPDEAAVENVFVSRNASSALKLGQARGAAVSALAVRGVPVASYEPTKVKQSLVGTGRAGKDQVAFMVGQILGMKPNWAEDASDALAVAICHLNMRRLARLAGAR